MVENQLSEEGISLVDLLKIVHQNLLLIIAFTGLFAILAFGYVFFIANPKYQSNADVMIQIQTDSTVEGTYDYTTAQKLLTTIAEFMEKDVVLEDVILELGLTITPEQIRSGLVITSSSTSYFVNISYESESGTEAILVVNQIINSAITIADNNDAFSSIKNIITRTSYANEAVYSSPNKTLYVIIGILLGGIAGLGIVFIKELFNNTFRSKEELEQMFGVQLLGIIPDYEIKGGDLSGKK